ncbi:mannonate dehydratase [Silvibacterium acidisoli]|uniref:mannonate dehydratase n=1 Tax=Acidobacteriaceae bacterium ZG23-2 TaxID=2883246 RepID=UPI00406D3357
MKIGLGLYRHMLSRENYDFARQAGCTHVVIHLVDYFRGGNANPNNNQPTGGKYGYWGVAGDPDDAIWSARELKRIRSEIEDAGLILEAIENLDPATWYDVILGGPRRDEQIERIAAIVRNMGEAGIPTLGYNFSIAGVCGRVSGPWGRGGAVTVGSDGPLDEPLANGTVWNMIYDPHATGQTPSASYDELWKRLEFFLQRIIPVAEQAGVRLAAHPDDPPMPSMRRQPRLVYQPDMYQRLIDVVPSTSNALEFCVGTISEMREGSVYDAVDRYSRQGKIAYVHLRNITGKVPEYRETFIDEGDVDMVRVLGLLHANSFEGVVIPDHTPQMTCAAPWHSGMAHTIGFIQGVLATLPKRPKQGTKQV